MTNPNRRSTRRPQVYQNFAPGNRISGLDPVTSGQGTGFYAHSIFKALYGAYQLGMTEPNGLDIDDGSQVPDTAVVITDALVKGGLMPYDPTGKDSPEYPAMVALFNAARAQNMKVFLPFDAHPSRANLNDDALTNIRLTPDFLARLSNADRQIAVRKFAQKIASEDYLTVAELEEIVGDLKDIEFYTFGDHCIYDGEEFAPEIQAAVTAEAERIRQADIDGDSIVTTNLFPVPKATLQMAVPHNSFGYGGNHFEALLLNAFNGFPNGGRYTGRRQVVMGGTSMGYTLDFGARGVVALGIRVHLLLSSCFAIPAGYSKLTYVAPMRQTLPTLLTASYRWDENLLGPEPEINGVRYNEFAYRALEKDRALHAASTAKHLPNELQLLDGTPALIVEDWDPAVW